MKFGILGAALLGCLFSQVASASLVTVSYDINIWAKQDVVLGRFVQFSPIAGPGSFQYDDTSSYIYTDIGGYYSSASFSTNGKRFVSPVTQYIPLNYFSNIGTSVSTSMYNSTSIMMPSFVYATESAYSQDNVNSITYQYSQSLNMPVLNHDLDGDGVSDFGAMTAQKFFDFFTGNIGNTYAFTESYSAYKTAYAGMIPNYEGFNWYGDFTVTSVTKAPNPIYTYPGYPYPYPVYPYPTPTLPPAGQVPEPSSVMLVIAGLLMLASQYKKRRQNA
jgi:hypothetical protein